MNNTFKKFLAVLLSVLTCLSCGVTAFAEEETPEEIPAESFTCDHFNARAVDIAVVTFDSKYSAIGETPYVVVDLIEVTLSKEIKRTEIDKDRIQMKIYEHNGKRYPQLFIDVGPCWRILSLEIGEGVFVTADGEKSAKLYIKENQMNLSDWNFTIKTEYEAYGITRNILDLANMDTYYYATVGKPIKINAVIEGKYAEVWKENVEFTYTVNGKTVEITGDEVIPEEAGKYVFSLNLDDCLKMHRNVTVTTEATAYFDNLGMYGTLFLLSPLMFVGGVLVLLYPGIGLLAAPSFFNAAIMSVPDFFKALFNGPEYTVKT
ncbi:MAG: hypothetical protein IJA02_06175 [Clostridia bacterium]|nr:hypothetical protein [Clostridia bacterium]